MKLCVVWTRHVCAFIIAIFRVFPSPNDPIVTVPAIFNCLKMQTMYTHNCLAMIIWLHVGYKRFILKWLQFLTIRAYKWITNIFIKFYDGKIYVNMVMHSRTGKVRAFYIRLKWDDVSTLPPRINYTCHIYSYFFCLKNHEGLLFVIKSNLKSNKSSLKEHTRLSGR